VLLVGIIRTYEMNFVGFSAEFCRLILTGGTLLPCPGLEAEIRTLFYVPIAYLIVSTQ
jgi:hypothetical protein